MAHRMAWHSKLEGPFTYILIILHSCTPPLFLHFFLGLIEIRSSIAQIIIPCHISCAGGQFAKTANMRKKQMKYSSTMSTVLIFSQNFHKLCGR